MSRPAICPACGRVHHERVPLACLACMVSDVEDTTFVEPPYDEFAKALESVPDELRKAWREWDIEDGLPEDES